MAISLGVVVCEYRNNAIVSFLSRSQCMGIVKQVVKECSLTSIAFAIA